MTNQPVPDGPNPFANLIEAAEAGISHSNGSDAGNSHGIGSFQTAGTTGDGQDSGKVQSPPTTQNKIQNQCGNSCSTNANCTGGNGCTCKTQSQSYQPGAGTVAFAAACIISLGGKRDEPVPCPCNGTYVSHACCRVQDGMVWEREEFKLGELLRGPSFDSFNERR